jgi:hypothetical protein
VGWWRTTTLSKFFLLVIYLSYKLMFSLSRPYFFFLWILIILYSEGVILGLFWPKITPLHIFFFAFNLNKWFSHRSSLLVVFCCCDFVVWVRRCVVRRLGTTLFDFSSCCGIPLVHIDRSSSSNCRFNSINDLCINVADPEAWTFRWL